MGKNAKHERDMHIHIDAISLCCILRKRERKRLSIYDCWNRSIFDNLFRRQLDFLNLFSKEKVEI